VINEARTFGRYIVERDIDATSCERYERAVRELGYDADDAVARFAAKHAWSIAPLDGALALTQPDATLRKKLLLMAAILETRPAYCDAFLPRHRLPGDALNVGYALVRAAVQTALGLLLLPFVR
jgi:hypothetical protein